MLEDFLLQVTRPARYIGKEWNLPKKDFAKADIRFALCFPDLYEIGMSNLGVRILYGILNKIEDVSCERVFSVDNDLEDILRKDSLEIFSLETRSRLKDFDIIGFSLASELGYTNALNILELGVIPLKASMRLDGYPLVIAGGPCALNPEPMHEFFDLFVIGEAEEAIVEIIDAFRKAKNAKLRKEELLFELSKIQGVYVPSLYEVEYKDGGKINYFKPKREGISATIQKRIVKEFDSAFFPEVWLIPYIQIVHDRLTLEIMRGCPNNCRFCQARSQYYPFRQRSPGKILNLARQSFSNTGYEEISLCGLSVSDYSWLEELLVSLINYFKKYAVGISLPSIKPKTIIGNISSLIASIKKTSLTFAPEAGSEKLRDILGKEFNKDEFFGELTKIYAAGYQHLKLYFMVGLPLEAKEDLDAIIDFSIQVSELKRKVNKAPAQLNLSINALIPKAHTPFQWFAMCGLEEIKNKEEYLRKAAAKSKRLKLDFHNKYMSYLEGVFCRGDRRLSEVILQAFKKGARFDAWGNHFNFKIWQDAFRECGIDPDFYLREKSIDELLPWDFLDVGISKEILIREYQKCINNMNVQ